jgi:hypothetical protein
MCSGEAAGRRRRRIVRRVGRGWITHARMSLQIPVYKVPVLPPIGGRPVPMNRGAAPSYPAVTRAGAAPFPPRHAGDNVPLLPETMDVMDVVRGEACGAAFRAYQMKLIDGLSL